MSGYKGYNAAKTFIPILLRLAPITGLTRKTVSSKMPKTRPYSEGTQPFFSASCG